ncbi:sensor histidine kinase [Maribellus maritimus]|uniref:sensor histidine kinase n=1 Tax=Maribellus maritimus TaxID=2870838 RepID=UPI001EEA25EC|nr:HAMP domain-containing sensor histidine kinase [Maribellus maritimus]MCG6188467.1 HAMP domain-containing histidine kinase [Maribellus maritimus]
MRLIKRTYIYTSVWLIPVLVIGSLFAFFIIEYITYEETDEFLTYEMERLVRYHEENNDLPDFHKVADIIPDLKLEQPVFKDTLLLESGDNEMVPHRELRFSINHNGHDFTIVIRHLLLGRDDIAQGTIFIITGLIFLIGIFLVLTLNIVAGRIWHPFYKTLNKITHHKIGSPPPDFDKTTIDEFSQLNSTLHSFLKKITDDFQHNKEFNENASHELQTHLAVIKANAGKLLGEGNKTAHLEELNKIYSAATKLSQIQKSLLLLSKINNREFNNNEKINFETILESSLKTFDEVAAIREIKISKETRPCTLLMDTGLAEILVNNLIKNAVKHNIQRGSISVKLTDKSLIIENSGQGFSGNPKLLLQRFSKGKNGNIGIGLAIVKEICEIYKFKLSYAISETNHHKIEINFQQG